jgi:hypothetical protein
VLVVADAASIYKHGPNVGHAAIIITSTGLLFPGRLLDFARLMFGRWDRESDKKG